MKKIYYIVFAILVSGLLDACIHDDTSLADPDFSRLSIISQYDTLSVNLSEEFVYKVDVVQSGEDRPLTYEWGYATYNTKDESDYPAKDSLKIISNEAELRYTFRKLGTYYLRLKVDNGEAISFKGFMLNVTTPYDEGITVLSQADAGNPRISFMKTLTRQEIESGVKKEFVTDVLTKENPDYTIKNCTDLAQFGPYLLLASREDGLIYKLNAKTFGVMYKNRVRDIIPDFTCKELMGSGATNWMLSENGSAYRYELTFDEVLVIDNAVGYGYDACFFGYSSSYQYFIDYDKSIIYSPTGNKATSSSNYFEDYNIIGMVPWTITKLYTIAVLKEDPSQGRVFQTSGSLSKLTELIKFDGTDLKLDKNSTIMFSKTYKNAYYDYGNNIYRWNCTGQFPKTPFITFPDTKEITAVAMDPDKTLIYVCYVDSERSGLKGGIDIYDANDGKLIESYGGIADRPLRVFYKTK